MHELGEDDGVHGEALLLGGETRPTDVVPVAGYGVGGGAADGRVGSGVPGRVVGAGGEDVVDDLYLTVAVDTGADADGRDGDSLGDELGQGCGDAFEDYGKCTCVLEGLGVPEKLGRLLGGLALAAVAAELVHRLGREPDVAHDRDAVLDDVVDGVSDGLTTLELDGLGTALLEKSRGVRKGFLLPLPVAHEG